jgi:hypothetical protein
MIDWMFAILLIMAFMLIVLIIQYHDDSFWGAMFTVIDIVLWFLLAVTNFEMESPTFQYNTTLSAYEPHLVIFSSKVASEMMYFFYMMALIMFIFFIGYYLFAPMYEVVTGKKWTKKEKDKD